MVLTADPDDEGTPSLRHVVRSGFGTPGRRDDRPVRVVRDGGGEEMKPRSLVFDLYGDYLRYRGGEVRLQGLVALMGCFGIPEATVRVVVGRLRRDGWLTSRRDGRETIYALTDRAWRLLDEGRDRIFRRADGRWDGEWQMVIYSVPESDRGQRDQLRKRLAWLGFGPLTSSVWVSPHDRSRAVLDGITDHQNVTLDLFRSRTTSETADRELAARAWDLDGLDRDYAQWLAAYEPRMRAYRSGQVDGTDSLVERMHLINDYRHFPFRDPDLPTALLPLHWTGTEAHQLFLEAHDLLEKPSEAAVGALLD